MRHLRVIFMAAAQTQRIVLIQRDPEASTSDIALLLREAAYEVEVKPSVDVVMAPADGRTPDLLIIAADLLDADVLEDIRRIRADTVDGPWVAALGLPDAQPERLDADDVIDGMLVFDSPRSVLVQVSCLMRQKNRLEQSMMRREQMTRIFERTSEAMLVIGLSDGKIVLANPAAADLFGIGLRRLVGRPFGHEEAVVMAEHELVEIEIVRAGRPSIFAAMRASTIDRPTGKARLLTLHDISGAREAAGRLAEGEQRYRSLFEQNPDAVYSVRPDGSFTSANAAFRQLTGYSSDEIPKIGCAELVAPDHAKAALAQFHRTMAGDPTRYETVGMRKDGSHFDADVKTLPIVVGGQIIGVYGIIKDVTERNALIRAQQDSARQLSLIFAQAATGIAITSTKGRFLDANPAFCQMVGFTLAELQATDLGSLTHAEDRANVYEDAVESSRMQVAKGGHPIYERRLVHRSGRTVWARVSVSVVRDGPEKPPRMVNIVEDISARQLAEASLRESQALVAMAGQIAQIGGWSVDLPTMTLRWSDEVARIHEEPVGFSPGVDQALSYYAPEHLPLIRDAFGCCIEHGTPFDVELQIVTASGRRRWVRAIGEAERDGRGRIIRVQGAFQQIDDRKTAEQLEVALRHRLQTILESIGDAFCTVDREWRFTYVNHHAERLVGRSRDDLLGRNLWQEFPGLVGTRFQAEYLRAANEGTVASFEEFYPQPINSWLEVNAYPSEDGLALYIRDVGDRRRAQDRMRLLESSIARLDDIVLITEADSIDEPGPRIVYANAAFERHTGYRVDEVIGRSPRLLQGLLTDRAALDRIRGALVRCEPIREELINYTKSGQPLWLEIDLVPVAGESGRVTHFIAVERNITERKRADDRLRQKLVRLALLQRITRAIGEHQDLRSIFGVLCETIERDMPTSLCVVAMYDEATEEFHIECSGPHHSRLVAAAGLSLNSRLHVDSNGLLRALEGHVVYEPELSELAHPLPRQLHAAGLNSVVVAPLAVESKVFGVLIAARHEPDGFASGDCEFLQQLAEHVALAAHESQLYSALEAAYEDLKESQAGLAERERLRATTQMANGIAHDINNAIAPVMLYADSLLESEAGLTTRARGQVETIRLAIADVADSVSRLRSFSRPDETIRRTPASLNTLVEQVHQLTMARWQDRPRETAIEVVTDFDRSLPLVATAEGEVREALTNLIFNALDAMPSGGTLTLRTLGRPTLGDLPGMVCIEVGDSGIGMDEATRWRCLEPYFTTKGERGTGLGLTMVSVTMRRLGGQIEIDSAPGKGTRMRLCFPLPQSVSQASPEALRPGPVAKPKRLLLIDDDPAMLRSLADILEEEGHEVHCVSGGGPGIEAFLAALHEKRQPFDLVVTDLGMPKVDGRQVAQAVKAASPTTPVLMLTGWGRRMKDAGERLEHVDKLLGKPPRLVEIREALATLDPGSDRNDR